MGLQARQDERSECPDGALGLTAFEAFFRDHYRVVVRLASVRISGWPGVLVADSSNAAAGVVWEDGRGMLHVVAGILDAKDVLNVAQQLG
jgi:hypothetical protein